MSADPLLFGHLFSGCPGWVDDWEEHFGRETLDSGTLANLQDMREADHWCSVCLVAGRG